MGLLARMIEKRSHPSNPDAFILRAFGGGTNTYAGRVITEMTSMQATAVFSCVKLISEDLASLPLPTYRRLKRGKTRDRRYPLYRVLHDRFNAELTAMRGRELMQVWVLLWGNAYAEIEYNEAGDIIALWPIPPWRMQVKRNKETRQLEYIVTLPDGGPKTLPTWKVFHVRGISLDGVTGISPIRYLAETVGTLLAAEELAARMFGSGLNMGGIVKLPGKLKDTTKETLRKSIEAANSGLGNAHRLLFLEEGMDYVKRGIAPDEAQFLETRRFNKGEVAAIYRVPPHKIGDLERATFSNIEQQEIGYVVGGIRPWAVRWEQEILLQLIPQEDQESVFAEHLIDALLRGDSQMRSQFYREMFNIGALTINDIRGKENLNPVDGGDRHFVPLNMVPLDQAGAVLTGSGEPDGGSTEPPDDEGDGGDRRLPALDQRALRSATSRRRLANSYRRVFADAAARVVRREARDVRDAIKRHLGQRNEAQFREWLEDYYRRHPEWIDRHMEPVFSSYGEAVQPEAADEVGAAEGMTDELRTFIRNYMAAFTQRHVGSSLGQLRSILDAAAAEVQDPVPILEERLTEWEERRPAKIARRESIQFGNAVALAVYVAAGTLRKRWVAGGDNCPYCDGLNGKVVGVERSFVAKGDSLSDGGSGKGPLTTRSNIGHPPIHAGCDCMIVASQ